MRFAHSPSTPSHVESSWGTGPVCGAVSIEARIDGKIREFAGSPAVTKNADLFLPHISAPQMSRLFLAKDMFGFLLMRFFGGAPTKATRTVAGVLQTFDSVASPCSLLMTCSGGGGGPCHSAGELKRESNGGPGCLCVIVRLARHIADQPKHTSCPFVRPPFYLTA